jgi:hypothetical protein
LGIPYAKERSGWGVAGFLLSLVVALLLPGFEATEPVSAEDTG